MGDLVEVFVFYSLVYVVGILNMVFKYLLINQVLVLMVLE